MVDPVASFIYAVDNVSERGTWESAATGTGPPGFSCTHAACARWIALLGSRQRPRGSSFSPSAHSAGSTVTRSTLRNSPRCWNPSSRIKRFPRPSRSASRPASNRSAPTTTATPRHSPRNQEWFIAGFLPFHDRAVAAADNQDSLAGSPVSSRQNDRTESFVSKSLGQRDDQRSFAGPSQREVADADDRMIQTHRSKQPGLIHLFSCTEQESKYAAHSILLRSNAVSLFV